MKFEDIDIFLANSKNILAENQSIEFLYNLYIELTIARSELHKIIHFCNDNYERKKYFSAIDLLNSLQHITDKKIQETSKTKSENLKYDYEIEQKYLEIELEKQTNQAMLFKEFSKELLSNKEYSEINNLARHCFELNITVKKYIETNIPHKNILKHG